MAHENGQGRVRAARLVGTGLAVAMSAALATACDASRSEQGQATSNVPSTSATSGSSTATKANPEPFAWSGLAPCTNPDMAGLQCGVLTVPLDHDRQGGETLDLNVGAGGNLEADRTLLLLSGGPGQPGPSLLPRLLPMLSGITDEYRVVMLDQRGTGAHALDCPRLQSERGWSDLMVPTPGAVRACADAIGPDREHFHTTDSVADFEDLRRALGVRRWAVDGVSYGTYTGARYAAAHGDHITHLVLDSPVPVRGFDATMAEVFPDFARVLRLVCAAPGRDCPGDPAADLHTLLQRRPELGPAMLNLVTTTAYIDSATLKDLPERLHTAAGGDDGPIEESIGALHRVLSAPADQYSQGIQASTLCADLDFPWGGANAPEAGRAAAADHEVAGLGARQLFPFNGAAARGNGEMVMCENWPRMADAPVPARDLRVSVPTLILAGDHDLGTPLTWARREHREIPGSRLVVVRGAGHSIQTKDQFPQIRRLVAEFLLG